jgi:hypothetical protein
MRSDATGMVTFKYGTFVLNTSGNPVFTVVGDADAESTYDPNGTITIVASRTKLGNPPIGAQLSTFLIRVRIQPAGVTPDNMPDSLAGEGLYIITGNAACAPKVTPISVQSEIVHPVAGPFGVTLPLTGAPGIECRQGPTTQHFTINMLFPAPVTFTDAMVTSGMGTVTSKTTDGTRVKLQLDGVTDMQQIGVTMTGLNDRPCRRHKRRQPGQCRRYKSDEGQLWFDRECEQLPNRCECRWPNQCRRH